MSIQIRQEVNLIDAVVTAAGDHNALVQLDPTKYNGTVTAYLEVVAKVASGTLTVALQAVGSASNTASCSVTSTSYSRVRSSSFSLPASATEYQVNLSGGTTPSVQAA